MNRRSFVLSSLSFALNLGAARAQNSAKIARIGWLTAQRAASLTPFVAAFNASLIELGYVEGKNLLTEFRYGDDALARVPQLADELVRIPVDVLVVQGAAVGAVAKLNLPVPVVYVTSSDPVVAGLADSLSRPRGNMTGLTFMAAEFNGKRIELLRELLPNLKRVTLMGNPDHPGEHYERGYSEEMAKRLGISVSYFPTRTLDDLKDAFAAMTSEPPEAISLFGDGFAVQNRQTIIDFAMAKRAPVISGWAVFARSGALCSYGPALIDSYRRLATYVDRILKGVKTADMPIERPAKYELVLNLKTAAALGIEIAPGMYARADEVIE